MTPAARFLDRIFWAYQKVTEDRVSPCRYVPTCSTYGREALAHHDAVRGSWLTLRRLLRCHPWGGHGHDPVPGTEDASSIDPPDTPAPATETKNRSRPGRRRSPRRTA